MPQPVRWCHHTQDELFFFSEAFLEILIDIPKGKFLWESKPNQADDGNQSLPGETFQSQKFSSPSSVLTEACNSEIFFQKKGGGVTCFTIPSQLFFWLERWSGEERAKGERQGERGQGCCHLAGIKLVICMWPPPAPNLKHANEAHKYSSLEEQQLPSSLSVTAVLIFHFAYIRTRQPKWRQLTLTTCIK